MKPLSNYWIKISPGLGRAHMVIRRTRSEQYFDAWDRLTNSWMTVFGIPPDVGPVAGANIGTGIDQLFEQCETEESMPVLFDDLQALTDPWGAAAFMSSAERIAETEPSLKESVQLHLAVLTSVGYSARSFGAGLGAGRWLAGTLEGGPRNPEFSAGGAYLGDVSSGKLSQSSDDF